MTASALRIAGFGATHFAIVLILLASAYGLGRRILRRVTFANAAEETSFSAALGLGIIAQSVFLLGLVHLIYPVSMVLLIAAAATAGWRQLRDGVTRILVAIREWSWLRRSAAVAIGLVVVFFAIFPLYPPYVWDAISYHLPSARFYAVTHAVQPTPYLIFCVFTQLNEMLYTLAFTVSDAITAQCIEFLLYLLSACAAAGAAARVAPRAALPAAAAWLGIPPALLLGSQGYIDVGVALYTTTFIAAAWNWLEERRWPWLLLAAANAGFAASMKYTAVFLIGCFGLLLCYFAAKERSARLLLTFTAVVAAMCLPWYAYIYYHTGNPVFPFLSRIFGTGCWDAGDIAHVEAELSHLGTGHTLDAFVRLPWNLAFALGDFAREAPLSKIYLGIPLWIGVGLASSRTRFAAAMFAAYLVFWFFTAQSPRYLFPVLPTMCILVGCTLAWVLRALPSIAATVIAAIITVLLTAPAVRFAYDRITLFGRPPVNAQETAFFFRTNPTYECYEWLNERYGHNYTVFAFDPSYMKYFADGIRIGDVVGPGRLREVVGTSGARLKESLDKFAVQFVLFSSDPASMTNSPPQDQFFRSHFRPVATCKAGTVFRMTSEPFRRELGPELVRNGSFDEPERQWSLAPDFRVDATGNHSHSGSVAVRVDPDSIQLMQSIAVSPNRTYQISFFSRTDAAAARARFIASWFDAKHVTLRDDVNITNVAAGWAAESLVAISPDAAATVEIYPESEGGTVWYDDVSLREVVYVTAPAATSAAPPSVYGVFRPSDHRLFARHDISAGFADEIVTAPADGLPVAGDWDGDGRLEAGVYAPDSGTFFLTGTQAQTVRMRPSMLPVAGRWTADTRTSVGTFDPRRAQFELRTGSGSQPISIAFGQPGDVPVTGDWDGDGISTIGVYRASTATFYLRNRNSAGPPDLVVPFGTGRELPVAADWNGDGHDSPGLFDSQAAVFQLVNEDGTRMLLPFGIGGDLPFSATVH